MRHDEKQSIREAALREIAVMEDFLRSLRLEFESGTIAPYYVDEKVESLHRGGERLKSFAVYPWEKK